MGSEVLGDKWTGVSPVESWGLSTLSSSLGDDCRARPLHPCHGRELDAHGACHLPGVPSPCACPPPTSAGRDIPYGQRRALSCQRVGSRGSLLVAGVGLAYPGDDH